MITFNNYAEFKEAIVKIIEQRTDVWSDETLSAEEFRVKDDSLEQQQWTIFKKYPDWHEQYFNELASHFITE
jgi:hypothetical protein